MSALKSKKTSAKNQTLERAGVEPDTKVFVRILAVIAVVGAIAMIATSSERNSTPTITKYDCSTGLQKSSSTSESVGEANASGTDCNTTGKVAAHGLKLLLLELL